MTCDDGRCAEELRDSVLALSSTCRHLKEIYLSFAIPNRPPKRQPSKPKFINNKNHQHVTNQGW